MQGVAKKILFIYPSAHFNQTPIVELVFKRMASDHNCKLVCFHNNLVGVPATDVGSFTSLSIPNGSSEISKTLSPSFIFAIKAEIRAFKPDVLFYVGEKALILGPIFAGFAGIRKVYLNLELKFPEDFAKPWIFRLANIFLQQAIKSVDLAITFDRNRARLMSVLLKIRKDKIRLVPNIFFDAVFGDLGLPEENRARGYAEAPTEKLLVYSGSLHAAWAGMNWVESSAARSQSNPAWKLITHNRLSARDGEIDTQHPSSYLKSLQDYSAGYAYYDGCHSRNIKYVGLSSGKLLSYLFAGLPIVVNEIPYWSNAISRSRLGLTFNPKVEGVDILEERLDAFFEDAALARDGRNHFVSELTAAARSSLGEISATIGKWK